MQIVLRGAAAGYEEMCIRDRGGAACFVSLFGTAPDDLPYRMGTAVDAAVEVSIFQGRGGPMVSCHCCAMRPAGLGNAPAEQAAR